MTARVKLTGVVEDGTRPYNALPLDGRVPLKIRHRVPTTVEVSVVTEGGIPFVLEAGDAFALVVKERANCGGLPILQLAGELAPTVGPNVARFTLSASATENLEPRHYQYDIWMVRAGAGRVLVPTSLFILERTVYAP